jgi:Na+/glutamate symporter
MMNEDGKKEEAMADVVVDDEENAEDKPSGGGGNMNLNVTISDLQLPLVIMFSASTIQLIAVMTWKVSEIKWREYAISVPSVGMGLTAVALVMTFFEKFYREHGKWFNQFLFVWNFVGACFLTFSSPFIFTGNVSLKVLTTI